MPRLHLVSGRPQPGESATDQAERLLDRYLQQVEASGRWHNLNLDDYPAAGDALAADPALQVALTRVLVAKMLPDAESRGAGSLFVLQPLDSQLWRRRIAYAEHDVLWLLGRLAACRADWDWIAATGVQGLLRTIQRYVDEHGLSDAVRRALEQVHANAVRCSYEAAARKSMASIEAILQVGPTGEELIDPADDWGAYARQALDALAPAERAAWIELLAHFAEAQGSKPSKQWLKQAQERVERFGRERLVVQAVAWLGLLDRPTRNEVYLRPDGQRYPTAFVADRNADLLKGLAWCCAPVEDDRLAQALGTAAACCYRKLTMVGARSTKAGNACLWALGAMPDLASVNQLQRLTRLIRQPSGQKQLEAALQSAADRLGCSREDLDDLAPPTFGLVDGRIAQAMGSFTAVVDAGDGRAVELRWLKADGSPQVSAPAVVKQQLPEELRDLKQTVEELREALATQRSRLERLYLSARGLPLARWRELYLDQPLRSLLARRLIWELRSGEQRLLGAWHDGQLVDLEDRPLDELADDAEVRLWHPNQDAPDTVLAWRRWLARHAITQPFKQAHREVYLLTEAERQTALYSNRFANHVLKQHQLQALCRERGWRYQLQSAHFDGANAPTLSLPRWDLEASFQVDCPDDVRSPLSGHGISLYVTTDAVRFARPTKAVRGLLSLSQPVPLADVPPIVFSEVMRDVDLFVGLCSVGNDPVWQVTHGGEHVDYWWEFSFGELSASAETRREVLAQLLPRLKIAGRCSLEGKFLVVRGDLRTYRIHLGSSNVLMEPNSQYLCLVPGAGASNVGQSKLFLPFESDTQLSLILSKALLLADDARIKDPSIVRQIR